MGGEALKIAEVAAEQVAKRTAVRLVLVEAAPEAATFLGLSALAWTGIGVVVALGGIAYLIYKHKSGVPPSPNSMTPCTAAAAPAPESLPAVPTSPASPVAGPSTAAAAQPEGVVKLKCKDDWDDCQKRQAREKVRRLNELAEKAGGLDKASPKVADGDRRAADMWAKKFRLEFEKTSSGKLDPSQSKSGATGSRQDFMDDCLYEEWKKMKADGKADDFLDGVSPDHVQDVQLKGDPKGPLQWLDQSVNVSLGSQIQHSKEKKIRKFVLDCE